MRSVIADSRRLVVKVGSSLVTNDGRGLDHAAIGRWAAQIAALRAQGKEVVLVSAGAIAEGMQRLGWTKRPREIDELQAAAAVGQMGLAQVYESSFAKHGMRTAQILLTHADLADRERDLKLMNCRRLPLLDRWAWRKSTKAVSPSTACARRRFSSRTPISPTANAI